MISLAPFIPSIAGAVVGVILKALYDIVMTKRRFKRELEDNNHIDVTGDWFAAWQTSVDDKELINTEHVKVEQKGKTLRMWNTSISPENPKAGYLWEGQLQFFQGKNLMGWYFPKRSENNASRGIMYLTYFSPRKRFIGKWVGTAYDGELVSGAVVIEKDGAIAARELQSFIAMHPQDVRLIGYSGLS